MRIEGKAVTNEHLNVRRRIVIAVAETVQEPAPRGTLNSQLEKLGKAICELSIAAPCGT